MHVRIGTAGGWIGGDVDRCCSASCPCARAADNVGAPTVASAGTVLYDSTSYTTEDNEDLQCGSGVTGGKSGWTRFDADSSGVLTITLASDYDAILHIYVTATTASAPALGDLKDAACVDDDHTATGGVESRAIGVLPGQSIYVQTLGVGADPGSAAGMNSLKLAFAPDDSDGDRVPDASDACPQVPGLQADGCPPAATDTDQDGVLDANDRCPTTSGDLANGCLSHLYGDIRGLWQTNRLLTKLVSLVVEAPVGSRIDLQCKGRKGACPFTPRAHRADDTADHEPQELLQEAHDLPECHEHHRAGHAATADRHLPAPRHAQGAQAAEGDAGVYRVQREGDFLLVSAAGWTM